MASLHRKNLLEGALRAPLRLRVDQSGPGTEQQAVVRERESLPLGPEMFRCSIGPWEATERERERGEDGEERSSVQRRVRSLICVSVIPGRLSEN